jgi:CHAT domain-containing protein
MESNIRLIVPRNLNEKVKPYYEITPSAKYSVYIPFLHITSNTDALALCEKLMSKLFLFLIFFFQIFFLLSCSQQHAQVKDLSFDEAKRTVLEMQNIPLSPPPRKINDVLDLLNRKPDIEKEKNLARLKRIAREPAPVNHEPYNLFQFYKVRGMAKYELNQFNEASSDFKTSINYGVAANIHEPELYRLLADLAMNSGRYDEAMKFGNKAVEGVYQRSYIYPPLLAYNARIKLRLGDYTGAWLSIKRAQQLYSKIPPTHRYSFIASAKTVYIGNQNDLFVAEAEYLESQGQYIQAHQFRVRSLNFFYSLRNNMPLRLIRSRLSLASNLRLQGRLIEAEKEARDAVIEAVRLAGRNSGITAEAIQMLAEILLDKNELNNARVLSEAQQEILLKLDLSAGELLMIQSCLLRAEIELVSRKFIHSIEWYDIALEQMRNNQHVYNRYAKGNFSLIFILIKNNRLNEAHKLLKQSKEITYMTMLADRRERAEFDAFDAMIDFANGNKKRAMSKFSVVTPRLIDILHSPGSRYMQRVHAEILLQTYIDILLEVIKEENDPVFEEIVSREIFRIAGAEHSRVNNALSKNNARAASLRDPELNSLVRDFQDVGNRIEGLKNASQNLIASSIDASSSLDELLGEIQKFTAVQLTLFSKIEKNFPRYIDLVNPKPPKFEDIQAHLEADESLIFLWTTHDKTFVWAIPHKGNPLLNVSNMGEAELQEKVIKIRNSILPRSPILTEIPTFEVELAYELFRALLLPVEKIWTESDHVFTVIKGPLDQLPLSILPEKLITPRKKSNVWFSEYQNIPWLITHVSITRLPSPATLVLQRPYVSAKVDREPFIGFGDSIFNEKQQRKIDKVPVGKQTETFIGTRGVRKAILGSLDTQELLSVHLEDLKRLPDTAMELNKIAYSLDADLSKDVYLRENASEDNIKKLNLAKKEIIAFATHALRPGDLDGLDESALAFSSPQITGGDEDGVLTVGEILTLRLNADLIILSACDSGAADSSGSEAISGLGKAFFYAGARALLVTMWPVETHSAGLLSSRIFNSKKNGTLSLAKAQQKVLLKMIHSDGINGKQGNMIASYAHPFFWAPYLVVADVGSSAK